MDCPRCNRPGFKKYKGYCSKVHYLLEKKTRKKALKLVIPCKSCGKPVVRNPSQVARSGNVYCKTCKKPHGENHVNWQEGQYINKDGYRLILVNGSYQREHRQVWEKYNKASLLPMNGSSIHHIDFDKLNNSPHNLLLFSNEEHSSFHRAESLGRYDEAAALLKMAADRQAFYPKGVDSFILRMFMRKKLPSTS